MQPRERLLAAVVALMAVGMGGAYAVRGFLSAYQQRSGQQISLLADLDSKQSMVTRGVRSQKRINELRDRSLPDDPSAASSLFQNWLLKLVDDAGLSRADVKPNTLSQRLGGMRVLRFTVHGQGTLEQASNLLYKLYASDYLHQASTVHLKRLDDEKQLDVTIVVEALLVSGAERRASLAEQPSDRLALGDRQRYRDAILNRNLYAAYTPPPPPERPREPPPARPMGPPPFDESTQAHITGITGSDGQMAVWIRVLTSGKQLTLKVGDKFQIGTVEGVVTRIGRRDVEIATAEGPLRVTLGQTLRGEG